MTALACSGVGETMILAAPASMCLGMAQRQAAHSGSPGRREQGSLAPSAASGGAAPCQVRLGAAWAPRGN